nr:phosphopentomutase [Lachnospiraceae bacterium]
LDHIRDAGKDVIAIGKIYDIFAGAGITEHTYTTGNPDGIEKTIDYMDKDWEGLMFVNLVDYDMLYGHRRDIDGYARAVAYFDGKLPEIFSKMRDDDILMITADHGCDPAFTKTTDHTRECVPLLIYGKNVKSGNLGTRDTFADIAATVMRYLSVNADMKNTAGKPLFN